MKSPAVLVAVLNDVFVLFLNDRYDGAGHDGPAGVRYGSRNHAPVALPRQLRRQYARQQNQTDEKRP